MMRSLVCAAMVMACSGQAAAIDIWLSGSDQPSAPPANSGAVPIFHNFESQGTGSVFVWARPDTGETIERWSLRLTSSKSSVLSFDESSIEDYNLLDDQGNQDVADDEVRWEFTSGPAGNSSHVDLFGFRIPSPNPVRDAEGIGPTCSIKDQFCGLADGLGSDSWLLAKVNYTLGSVDVGQTSTTDLKFQIGSVGISQLGEFSSDAEVRFGDLDDNFLDGEDNRLGTGTPKNANLDAQIVLHDTPNADFNNDSDVDGGDFLTWQRGFGNTGGNATRANGDATSAETDDRIDEVDLAAWELQFGTGLDGLVVLNGNVVPEPATGALAVSMFFVMLAGRRRSDGVRHLENRGVN